ncbi:hypothetical protein C9374_000199 [Naegleria lovaniensis]|uniref:Uncharacterized protein n=1 Tax=Naegleria lovaniensis TaxID=51637 RepID=A0AA88GTT7_NAELO|nr:uncharacterized protein C9374_000199 [Naegleria lovaniensis]KAG2388760.1 hypothetical protein C9374_000199 [Naegleria lovaniensis]
MKTSTALSVHHQLHNKQVGDFIDLPSVSYPILLRSCNQCKYTFVENICFIEQNPKSNSEYGTRASHHGEKITWMVMGTQWGLIIGDSIETSCQALDCHTTSFVKLDDTTIMNIHHSLHNSTHKQVEIEGQVFEKKTNKQCHYFEINGTKFMQQNKQKNSEYAKKAKKGHKITWVMVSNVAGFKGHKSWGLIVDEVIEKDCLIFQRNTSETTPSSTNHNHNSIQTLDHSSHEEHENYGLEAPSTPVKSSKVDSSLLKRSLSNSSPSLFASPSSSLSSSTEQVHSTRPSDCCSKLQASPFSSSDASPIPVRSRKTRTPIRKRRKNISSLNH